MLFTASFVGEDRNVQHATPTRQWHGKKAFQTDSEAIKMISFFFRIPVNVSKIF